MPTNPNASRFTELTTEQVEAQRRSAYAYAFPPAPELAALPDGTCSVDTGVGRTVFVAPAPPAPAPMSAYRLARVHQIRQMVEDFSEDTPGRPTLARAFADLFADRSWLMLETVRLEARAAEAEATIERATKQLQGFDGVRDELELLGCAHDGFPTVLDAQLHDLWKFQVPLYLLEEAEAQVAMLRVELEVEQAKTALLWPVATKQRLARPGGAHPIICQCSARSENECTCHA